MNDKHDFGSMSSYRVIKFKNKYESVRLQRKNKLMTDKTVTCTMNGSIIQTNKLFNLANYTIPGGKLEEEQMDDAAF